MNVSVIVYCIKCKQKLASNSENTIINIIISNVFVQIFILITNYNLFKL